MSSMSYGLTTWLLRRRIGGDRRRAADAAPVMSIHPMADCDRPAGSAAYAAGGTPGRSAPQPATEDHRLTVPWPTCNIVDTRRCVPTRSTVADEVRPVTRLPQV